MAREGAFDGLDAVVMAHPYGYDLADQVWLGRRTLTVEYHGATAHASAQPYMGRNALDAASLMYQGIGLMRQQTPPSDRIHAVIREGGERASVVPDYAKLDLYARSQAPETLRDLSRRLEDRKSTRLNSSHVATSYAVFCLNKKNTALGRLTTHVA